MNLIRRHRALVASVAVAVVVVGAIAVTFMLTRGGEPPVAPERPAVVGEVTGSNASTGEPVDLSSGVPVALLLPEGLVGLAPVTFGMPLPADVDPKAVTVADDNGPVPTQVNVQAELGDGMTWTLIDFAADASRSYRVVAGAATAPDVALSVEEDSDGGVVVDTGAGRFAVPATSALLGEVATSDGVVRVEGADFGADPVAANVQIVRSGPLHAVLRVDAEAAVAGLDVRAYLHFFAGQPAARVRITLTNHNAATWGEDALDADNGECEVLEGQPICNGLGSPDRIEVEDVTWSLQLADGGGAAEVIYQDSSGTDAWDYYADLAPRMQSGTSRRGFVHTVGGAEVATGDTIDGVLVSGGVRLDVPWFREMFPKALRAGDGRLEFGIFPKEFADAHVLRAGEQKTHDVWVSLDADRPAPAFTYAAPDLGWLRTTEALGYLGPLTDGPYDDYVAALLDDGAHTQDDCNNDLDDCATSLGNARERWDYFGWTDFGDVPTDFENPRSPYNVKYDMNLGFVYQALRTNDPRWWEWARAANEHFADIDIFHAGIDGYDEERSWWEGGAWGHSYHGEAGITNPHRNCGNPNPDLYYGVAGMTAWALLTGDEVVRDAAVELADNTLWRVRNSADSDCVRKAFGGGNGEGYALADVNVRGAANSMRILTWAWRLTGDEAYLDTAGRGGAWYECEKGALTCASWKEALLGRGLAEYLITARLAGIEPVPTAEEAFTDVLDSLAANVQRDGDRMWFTGCTGEEINAWMFLAADVFAYGYAITGEQRWLDEYATPSFTTAARDPYYEGDTAQYHTSKEVANTVPNALVYLHFATGGGA